MSRDKRKISRDSIAETLTISIPCFVFRRILGLCTFALQRFVGVVFRAPTCDSDGVYVSKCQYHRDMTLGTYYLENRNSRKHSYGIVKDEAEWRDLFVVIDLFYGGAVRRIKKINWVYRLRIVWIGVYNNADCH